MSGIPTTHPQISHDYDDNYDDDDISRSIQFVAPFNRDKLFQSDDLDDIMQMQQQFFLSRQAPSAKIERLYDAIDAINIPKTFSTPQMPQNKGEIDDSHFTLFDMLTGNKPGFDDLLVRKSNDDEFFNDIPDPFMANRGSLAGNHNDDNAPSPSTRLIKVNKSVNMTDDNGELAICKPSTFGSKLTLGYSIGANTPSQNTSTIPATLPTDQQFTGTSPTETPSSPAIVKATKISPSNSSGGIDDDDFLVVKPRQRPQRTKKVVVIDEERNEAKTIAQNPTLIPAPISVEPIQPSQPDIDDNMDVAPLIFNAGTFNPRKMVQDEHNEEPTTQPRTHKPRSILGDMQVSFTREIDTVFDDEINKEQTIQNSRQKLDLSSGVVQRQRPPRVKKTVTSTPATDITSSKLVLESASAAQQHLNTQTVKNARLMDQLGDFKTQTTTPPLSKFKSSYSQTTPELTTTAQVPQKQSKFREKRATIAGVSQSDIDQSVNMLLQSIGGDVDAYLAEALGNWTPKEIERFKNRHNNVPDQGHDEIDHTQGHTQVTPEIKTFEFIEVEKQGIEAYPEVTTVTSSKELLMKRLPHEILSKKQQEKLNHTTATLKSKKSAANGIISKQPYDWLKPVADEENIFTNVNTIPSGNNNINLIHQNNLYFKTNKSSSKNNTSSSDDKSNLFDKLNNILNTGGSGNNNNNINLKDSSYIALTTQLTDLRFDLQGNIVVEAALRNGAANTEITKQTETRQDNNEDIEEEEEYRRELYHHGKQAGRAGYTIDELIIYLRSTYYNQICLALKTLYKILLNCRLGRYNYYYNKYHNKVVLSLKIENIGNETLGLYAKQIEIGNFVYYNISSTLLETLLLRDIPIFSVYILINNNNGLYNKNNNNASLVMYALQLLSLFLSPYHTPTPVKTGESPGNFVLERYNNKQILNFSHIFSQPINNYNNTHLNMLNYLNYRDFCHKSPKLPSESDDNDNYIELSSIKKIEHDYQPPHGIDEFIYNNNNFNALLLSSPTPSLQTTNSYQYKGYYLHTDSPHFMFNYLTELYYKYTQDKLLILSQKNSIPVSLLNEQNDGDSKIAESEMINRAFDYTYKLTEYMNYCNQEDRNITISTFNNTQIMLYDVTVGYLGLGVVDQLMSLLVYYLKFVYPNVFYHNIDDQKSLTKRTEFSSQNQRQYIIIINMTLDIFYNFIQYHSITALIISQVKGFVQVLSKLLTPSLLYGIIIQSGENGLNDISTQHENKLFYNVINILLSLSSIHPIILKEVDTLCSQSIINYLLLFCKQLIVMNQNRATGQKETNVVNYNILSYLLYYILSFYNSNNVIILNLFNFNNDNMYVLFTMVQYIYYFILTMYLHQSNNSIPTNNDRHHQLLCISLSSMLYNVLCLYIIMNDDNHNNDFYITYSDIPAEMISLNGTEVQKQKNIDLIKFFQFCNKKALPTLSSTFDQTHIAQTQNITFHQSILPLYIEVFKKINNTVKHPLTSAVFMTFDDYRVDEHYNNIFYTSVVKNISSILIFLKYFYNIHQLPQNAQTNGIIETLYSNLQDGIIIPIIFYANNTNSSNTRNQSTSIISNNVELHHSFPYVLYNKYNHEQNINLNNLITPYTFKFEYNFSFEKVYKSIVFSFLQSSTTFCSTSAIGYIHYSQTFPTGDLSQLMSASIQQYNQNKKSAIAIINPQHKSLVSTKIAEYNVLFKTFLRSGESDKYELHILHNSNIYTQLNATNNINHDKNADYCNYIFYAIMDTLFTFNLYNNNNVWKQFDIEDLRLFHENLEMIYTISYFLMNTFLLSNSYVNSITLLLNVFTNIDLIMFLFTKKFKIIGEFTEKEEKYKQYIFHCLSKIIGVLLPVFSLNNSIPSAPIAFFTPFSDIVKTYNLSSKDKQMKKNNNKNDTILETFNGQHTDVYNDLSFLQTLSYGEFNNVILPLDQLLQEQHAVAEFNKKYNHGKKFQAAENGNNNYHLLQHFTFLLPELFDVSNFMIKEEKDSVIHTNVNLCNDVLYGLSIVTSLVSKGFAPVNTPEYLNVQQSQDSNAFFNAPTTSVYEQVFKNQLLLLNTYLYTSVTLYYQENEDKISLSKQIQTIELWLYEILLFNTFLSYKQFDDNKVVQFLNFDWLYMSSNYYFILKVFNLFLEYGENELFIYLTAMFLIHNYNKFNLTFTTRIPSSKNAKDENAEYANFLFSHNDIILWLYVLSLLVIDTLPQIFAHNIGKEVILVKYHADAIRLKKGGKVSLTNPLHLVTLSTPNDENNNVILEINNQADFLLNAYFDNKVIKKCLIQHDSSLFKVMMGIYNSKLINNYHYNNLLKQSSNQNVVPNIFIYIEHAIHIALFHNIKLFYYNNPSRNFDDMSHHTSMSFLQSTLNFTIFITTLYSNIITNPPINDNEEEDTRDSIKKHLAHHPNTPFLQRIIQSDENDKKLVVYTVLGKLYNEYYILQVEKYVRLATKDFTEQLCDQSGDITKLNVLIAVIEYLSDVN